MSLNRYAKKTDATQAAIVAGLRKAGIQCWVMGRPVDLLTLYRGVWLPLECKSHPRRTDKRQKAQNEFMASTRCPRVTTIEEAWLAVTGHAASRRRL